MLLAALATFSFSTWAQTAEGTARSAPDEIIIAGVRTPLPAADMATAVTVIDREALDLRQSFQLVDVLRDVPGLTVARSGPVGSQAQLRMRGAEANHVLVLIDGVEANDPASGDEFLFEHLSAMEVERVEVIRGPQSALWGSDAVAGVINIVTRKAEEGFGGGASGEGGSQNTWAQSAWVHYGKDIWRLNIGASRRETDGTNVSRQGSEDDGYRLTTAQARLRLDPVDAISVDLTARYVEAHTQTDPVDFISGLPVDGDRESEVERTVLGGVLDYDQGRLAHRLGINWLESDNESFADGSLSGTVGAERLKFFYQGTFEVVDGHRVTAAVDYRDTDFVQTGAATMFGDPNHSQSLTNTGYVLDYVGEVSEGLTITASARYDDNSDFDNITTWRAGASLDISADTRLRGSYGRGHKAPTFGDRFGFFADTFIGNPDLKPEVSDSYEVGIDHVACDGKVRLGLTYFNAKLEDEINGFFFDLATFAFTAVNKDGESNRQGIEATLDAKLTDQITLGANYTWTDAEEPDGAGGVREEVRRPEHAGAISLTWVSDGGSSVSFYATLVGEAKDDFFGTFPATVVELKEYGLLSLAARTPLGPSAELYGRVEKATSSDYEDVFGFATPDISFFGGIKLKF